MQGVRTLPAAFPWHVVRDAAALAGAIYIGLVLAHVIPFGIEDRHLTGDALAYWSADLDSLYEGALGEPGAFLYSPAVAQALQPFRLLPYPVFYALYLAVNGYVLWRLRVLWALALPPVALDLLNGNLHVLYAGMIVLALRHPGAWSFGILTKITPGIGVLWHAVRGEWRAVGVALGVTAGIVAVSALFAPHLWLDWFALLAANAGSTPDWAIAIPLVWRVPVALAVTLIAARSDRAWLLPVAVMLALPGLWITAPAVLVAMPRLAAVAADRRSGDPHVP